MSGSRSSGSSVRCRASVLAVLVALAWTAALAAQDPLPYQDPALTPGERALDLLPRMNLDEKVGQMSMIYLSFLGSDSDVATYNLGALFGPEIIPPNTPLNWAGLCNRHQQTATQSTRWGIPLLFGTDAVHGNSLLLGAAVLPHHIGLGSTWNPSLVERCAHVTAAELRATGVRWTFSPVLDVARDDRWGRTFEAFGEDPYLAQVMGIHEVNGYQGTGLASAEAIAACAKHYLGAGGTANGVDRGNLAGPMSLIREVHLEPFIPALNHGMLATMASFSSVNGEPLNASHTFLTDVLKEELGFAGFVTSDWGAAGDVHWDYPTALELCFNAGLDMSLIPDDYGRFQWTLKDLVAAGRIPLSRIDDAVYRILLVKFSLGLFEDPFVDERATWAVGSIPHRKVARQAVRESVVLLKNDGILPLSKGSKIFVAGPNARNIFNQCGGWTVGWQRAAFPPPGTTILDALRDVAGLPVTFSENGTGAAGHDVAIVVVGEEPYAEFVGDVTNLNLPSEQLSLLDRVANSGTPMVVVMVGGRPRTGFESRLPGWSAFVMAWLPGTEGQGVADVLFGDCDATGRLPLTWPRTTGQEPINYDHRPGEPHDPLFEFGHGLSYTSFAYDNLTVDPSTAAWADPVTIRVDVTNTGARSGSEVVQVYATDVEASVPVPVKKLYRFQKVTLDPDETTTVSFTIPVAELGYYTDDPERTVEPGNFTFAAGGLTADLEVTTGGTGVPPAETVTPAPREPAPVPPPSVSPGNGTGLRAEYYTSMGDNKFYSLKSVVVDPRISFDPFTDRLRTQTGRSEFCAVRWTGWVEAQHSESYTFYLRVDDGARLWVDGKLLVDSWWDQAATEYHNNLSLTAGKKYRITLEYYQGGVLAVAQLFWSSLSIPKQIIPSSQLSVEDPDVWFIRHDSNSDGKIGLFDAMYMLSYLFRDGGPVRCPDASDANDDGRLNLLDAVMTLNFIFAGPTPAMPPGPTACGSDPTDDDLPQCIYDEGNCP